MKIEASLIQCGENGDNLITEVVIVDGELTEKAFFTHNANSYKEGPYDSPEDAGYGQEILADIMADDAVIDGCIFVDGEMVEPSDEQKSAIFSAL